MKVEVAVLGPDKPTIYVDVNKHFNQPTDADDRGCY